MDKEHKEQYILPVCEVLAVKSEGIVCGSETSGTGNGFPEGWN